MIPCSKLTDRWGRKRCLIGGLALLVVGALLSAIAPGLGVLIVGNSILEGVGTALLIPPVYILATLWFTDTTSRAWAFGAISGMGGVGAAAGPLIGGVIRHLDRLAGGVHLPGAGRGRHHPAQPQPHRSAARRPEPPVRRCGRGAVRRRHVLHRVRHPAGRRPQRAVRRLHRDRPRAACSASTPTSAGWSGAGGNRCSSTGLFKNRLPNLAMVTQNLQWLIMMGT